MLDIVATIYIVISMDIVISQSLFRILRVSTSVTRLILKLRTFFNVLMVA